MNRPADPSAVPASARSRRRSRLHAGAAILAFALAPLAVRGTPTVITDGLSVQTTAANAVHSKSAAIGGGNSAGGDSAFAAGEGNIVNGLWGNFAAGKGNSVNGYANGAIGSVNTVGNSVMQSFAWGTNNHIADQITNATAGGCNNIVYSQYGHAIGSVLENHSLGSVVLGWYNKPFGEEGTASHGAWRAQDSILVVGNGSGSGARSNALVVTKEGMTHIEVPPKGGISMGAYTSR